MGRLVEQDPDPIALGSLVEQQIKQRKARVAVQLGAVGKTFSLTNGTSERVVGGQ